MSSPACLAPAWPPMCGAVCAHGFPPIVHAGRLAPSLRVLYCGEVRHKGKVYAGEQAAIVERDVWQRAQALLRQRPRGRQARKRSKGLLPDVLLCGVCGSRMVPGYTTKRNRRYGYYVCGKAQQEGAAACPGQSIPAARLEEAIVAGLRGGGRS